MKGIEFFYNIHRIKENGILANFITYYNINIRHLEAILEGH